MIRVLLLLLLPLAAQAEELRIATFNTELQRDGPGLLLRDIQRDHQQIRAVVDVLVATKPDIVALQGIDWDHEQRALSEFAKKLRAAGLHYPHLFSSQPNSGILTPLDLDGDRRLGGAGDSQGWGRFTGQGGLAVLSSFPIITDDFRNYSQLRWRDLPGASLPERDGSPFPSDQAQSIQRLSSTGHWVVPIDTPLGRLNMMTFHATPPVFDGPEDQNGLRNRDEIRFWSVLLNGELGPAPTDRFVIAGDANLDPVRGEGHTDAIRELLANPLLQDPEPRDLNGSDTTVQWKSVGERRVDYVLPSIDWTIEDAGIYWIDGDGNVVSAAKAASRHRLVWVDLSRDDVPGL